MWDSALSSSRSFVLAALVAALGLGLPPAEAEAKVFYGRREALELAFPQADRIEDESIILEEEQARRIEALSRGELESRLVRIYRGYRGDELLGYAFIDVHNVRTHPEAFMVVISPEGRVALLRVLAFHEPLEYMPTDRWYEQFSKLDLQAPMRVGGDIHGIVGATLSARATTRGVRRALAFYEVVVKGTE